MIVSRPARAGQQLVVAVLEPAGALAGRVGEPDDRLGEVAVGHRAAGVGQRGDSGEGVGRDRLARRLGQLLGQHDVPGGAVQFGSQRGGRDMEQR